MSNIEPTTEHETHHEHEAEFKIYAKIKTKPVKSELQRLARQDREVIEETLACGSDGEQQNLLMALCPCRNKLYDLNVWIAIFKSARNGDSVAIKDQAQHAIGTLVERAKTDPRSQQLMQKLASAGVVQESHVDAIPKWIPNLRGDGLYIPRYEKSSRSKGNRRR